MNIGVDVRALQDHNQFRGIGIYLINLIAVLSQIDAYNEYSFFCWPGSNPVEAIDLQSGFKYKLIRLHRSAKSIALNRVRNCLVKDIKISKADVDVFLQPNAAYGLPWGNVPTAVVVYDLIPLIFQGNYHGTSLRGKILSRCLYWWQLKQVAKADHIIAISEATKRDLLHYLPRIASDKLSVIPLACNPSLKPLPIPESLTKFGINRRYLLYVGGIDFRKNVKALLEAYERVRECGHNLQLVLVGEEFKDGSARECVEIGMEISNLRHRHDVILTGFVDAKDLCGLYSSASVFVFPSAYEGFGMPVLEAMACGCPVIAYRNSAIPEVAGAAAMLLEPTDDLTGAIMQVIGDERLRARMTIRGLDQAQCFSWAHTARETLKILVNLL